MFFKKPSIVNGERPGDMAGEIAAIAGIAKIDRLKPGCRLSRYFRRGYRELGWALQCSIVGIPAILAICQPGSWTFGIYKTG
jgi:hypothetical protein